MNFSATFLICVISLSQLPMQLRAFSPSDTHPIIIADNHKYLGGKKVDIAFKPRVLQILFRPEASNDKPTYEIQLIGLGEPYTTTDPEARFTFLPGGNHQFKYRIFQNGIFSPWHTQEINIRRTINEMPWFYPALLIYLILVLGAITYFWIIYNLRQRLKFQTLRSKISANLHDETGSTLSSISLDLSTLERLLPPSHPKLQELITETRNMAEDAILKLRDTLWTIQPEHDDILDLAGRIGQSAAKMFAYKSMQFEFVNDLKELDNFQISMERRGDILHIAKEALNNSIKHSKANMVKLSLIAEKDGICMSIVDDGIGFDLATMESQGNGLPNFQQRAKDSFLELDIKSKPGEGTSISVYVPKL